MSGPTRQSRRRFLGTAGTLVALPWLEGLVAPQRALATTPGASPTRWLTYFYPNGAYMPSFKPTEVGAGEAWSLSPTLASLAPVKDDILVLSNLMNKATTADGAPHTNAAGGFLTGTPIEKLPGGQVLSGISADQLVAQAIGAETRFASLQVSADGDDQTGFCEEGFSCAYLQTVSWAGPQTPLPTIADPQLLFDRLFGGADSGASQLERAQRKAARRSVLDYVLEQAQVLKARLGQRDRLRMDQYMEGVFAVEQALAGLNQVEGAMCADPSAPSVAIDVQARVALMTDLMVLALQCDQTRVITFMIENEFRARYYDFLGVSNDHHTLTHHEEDPDWIQDVITIDTWAVSQFGALVKKLKAVEEGDGTLLDHCAVLFSSSMGDGNQHAPTDLPVILAGRANGQIAPGRHVAYSLEAPEARADLYIALMAMMGVEVETFGVAGTTPLHGLTG